MHVVTEEEAQSKAYSIQDVVMPLPGSQVQYPVYKHQSGKASSSCCLEEDSRTEAGKGLGQVSSSLLLCVSEAVCLCVHV